MTDQFIGQTVADKYRIESFMRLSGPAIVFHGRHVPTDRAVTISVLSPEFAADAAAIRRFLDRARTASHFADPNVLNVTDFGTDQFGRSYVVFEDAEGSTLKEAIERDGKFDASRAVAIAVQAASALNSAHLHNSRHGSVNPGNILVSVNPNTGLETAKLFDFGGGETNGEAAVKRVEYLAPEQAAGRIEGDARSDIYSLGVVVYEMLAGSVPFSDGTPTEILLKHLEEAPKPLSAFRSDLPKGIEPVVSKALSKDPKDRYQTAAEFAEDLKAAAAAPAGNNLWKTGLVVLAGIAILATALIYATSVKRTEPTTQLQADANGQPVQPINPATGVQEESLANMQGMTETPTNSNMAVPPGTIPGGDGYNPWANGGVPPAGGPPTYVGPGGQVITIDPNNPSQFMPAEGGVILVPVPANTNTAVKPTPTPKTPAANANTQAPPETRETPDSKPAPAKPEKTPAAKPSPQKPDPDEDKQ